MPSPTAAHAPPAGPGAAAAHPNAPPAPQPRTYTIMVAGAARGKTALLRLLLDTARLAPRPTFSAPWSASAATSAPSSASASALDPNVPYPVPTPENIARFVQGAARRTTHIRTCAVEVFSPAEGDRDRRSADQEPQTVMLNLVDTPSLDTHDASALERSLADVLAFIEARFAESIDDEQKARTGDHHVHLCLYLLDPDTIVPLPVSPSPSPILVPVSAVSPAPASALSSALPPHSHPHPQLSHLTLPPPPSASVSAPTSLTTNSHVSALPSPSPSASGSGTGVASGSERATAPAPISTSVPVPASSSTGSHADTRPGSGGALSPPQLHRRALPQAHPSAPSATNSDLNLNRNSNQNTSFNSGLTNGNSFSGLDPEAAATATTDVAAGISINVSPSARNGASASASEVQSNSGAAGVGSSARPSQSYPTPLSHSHTRPRASRTVPPPNPPHLPPIEVAAIKALSARTNVLPVLARVDTVGAARLAATKRAVRADLAAAGIGFGIFDAGPGSGEDLVTVEPPEEEILDDNAGRDEIGEVEMEVDAPDVPSSSNTGGLASSSQKSTIKQRTTKFPAFRIPRLPHGILSPDMYAHGEGVELDVYNCPIDVVDEDDVAEMMGLDLRFETLVKRYTPPSRVSSLASSPSSSAAHSRRASKERTSPAEGEFAIERNSDKIEDAQNGGKESEDKEKSPAVENSVDVEDSSKAENGAAAPTPIAKSNGHERSNSVATNVPSSTTKPKEYKGKVKGKENLNERNGLVRGRFVRRYRWGAVDALDPAHCDFVALRQAVFHHMQPLRTYTREYLFEKYRVEIHHQRQHLAAASSLHPSSYPTDPPSGASSAYPSSAVSPASALYPSGVLVFPSVLPAYPSVVTPRPTSAVSPRSATLLSPGVEVLATKDRERERERERDGIWERERGRDRRPGLFPTPVQQYQQHIHQHNASNSMSTDATSPGLRSAGVHVPVDAAQNSRVPGSVGELERVERDRERRAALPPLAHAAAAEQAVAPLPPLSAVSAGANVSPVNGRVYAREREYYARERGYDRDRERDVEREREREYRTRRSVPEYELERGYEYGEYRSTPTLPPPPIPSSRSYRDRSRDDYPELYHSEDEREDMEREKLYRREHYDLARDRERERERERERSSVRRPMITLSPRDRDYERVRERELPSGHPVNSGSTGLGLGLGVPPLPASSTATSTGTSSGGPPSASMSGLSLPLSAHPSARASPSSAYPQTPASAYPHAHQSVHVAARGERMIPAPHEKPLLVSGQAVTGVSTGAGAGTGARMHHMQHHHHGGGHVRGPVNPDLEFDRETVRERERERERDLNRDREREKERERDRERDRIGGVGGTGYGLRSQTDARPMGVDYAGRPVMIEEDVHSRLRTKKITVACNFCRSRKLKCDGGRPSCSQCIKRSHSCDYKAHARRRGGAALRSAQNQGQTAQEDAHSEGDEDGAGDLDAEYEPISGAEDAMVGPSAPAAAGPNGAGARHIVEHRPGSGSSGGPPMNSRRSSNVDLMIAETLQSPRSAAREREREREREMERDYVYVHGHPPPHAHVQTNGNPIAGQLAPLPFSAVNPSSASPGSASAPPGGSGSSPVAGGRPLTTNMHLLASASSSGGMISLGGMTPAEQAVAASATGRKRGGPKLSRISSNYGPKVVACNFCRARKTKCDGNHPTCQSCARRSLPCNYVTDGAPGRGRRNAGGQTAYKIARQEQKEREAQRKEELAKTTKAQLNYSPTPPGALSGASVEGEGEGDLEGEADELRDDDGEDLGEGEDNAVGASAAMSGGVMKRGFVDEESLDSGKKRLRMDEEARRVDIPANA